MTLTQTQMMAATIAYALKKHVLNQPLVVVAPAVDQEKAQVSPQTTLEMCTGTFLQSSPS